MSKSPDAFRSIGEVSRLVGVAPHVLRYWESQFPQLAPVKRADGRRYYRPDDVRLAAGLCQVMREEGLSIRGARRLIAADRGLGLREIGAARLGEARDHAAEPAAASPDTPAPESTPLPRPPRRAAKPAESLPLFDRPGAAPDWLARLATAAARLRRLELQGRPLPDRARQLRIALRDLR
ncbi:MerR family transcriptional regulator [Paracoccus sp. DMF]|uniref:MerR family transcriptional regulator n=1 Tax=Paracoccus sp. DMF TaxID=400837 RepID=UPI0021E462A7|nr:MerR family transcriptional regulator [Paracoccus sp. DMF]MCV2448242.1 MerR family transcriptional regulator [Paracoccus sp. DMF]